MWNVRKLTDQTEILAFLERDRLYATYAIADLEPEMFQYTRWYRAETNGKPCSLAMLFTALDDDSALVTYYAQEALWRMGVGMVLVKP